MKEKLLNATLATMLILTLTMANFIILGVNVATYASELLHQTSETNYKNVEFTTYFKTDSGDKIDMAKTPINTQGLKLYMQVAVKDEGYFNGEIEVKDSNFTVNQEKFSKEINKIEGNKVTLNQINAGQTVEVEVGITPVTDDQMDQGLLNTVSNVSLTGTYVSNKNRKTQIDSTKNVQLQLTNPYTENEGLILSNEIITNKLYTALEETTDEESGETKQVETTKRMIQIKTTTGLNGNQYPIKATNLQYSIPEGTEKIEVSSQGTTATNGGTNLNWENNDNQLNVKIENTPTEEGKISWAKSGEDVVVVTYILPEKAKVTNTEITTNDEITLYDSNETKITGNTSAVVKEEKDGTVEFKEISKDASLYKGKIYSKEEREINTNTNIYVNYENQTEQIKINEAQATYVGNNKLSANVQYKATTINKDQIVKILGEQGYLLITDENGNEIAKLTNDTNADENGNVVVNYNENVKSINIETSKPIAKGKIKIKHTKVIKPEEYTREEIRNVANLEQSIVATYNKETKNEVATIALKETESNASLSINNNVISTQRETEIEMRATLKANKEEEDLYKNPIVKIKLPDEVTNVQVSNISLLYEDELKIKSTQYDKENKIIKIELEGEQTKYHTDLNEGAQIYIAAKVSADELTPSKKSQILFTYSNQNSVNTEKTANLPVNIESKYGLMLYSKVLNYNETRETIKTIDSQIPTGKLDTNGMARTATMNLAVLNNYETTLTNIAVVGRIPNKDVDGGTFDTTLAQKINTNLEGAKVYYSENASANANDNTWQENIQDLSKVKSFKIVVEKMDPAQVLKIGYTFNIPEKLGYNQVVNSKFDATYTYVEKEMNATSGIQLKTAEKKLVQYIQQTSQNNAQAQTVKESETEQGLKVTTQVTTSGGDNKVTLKDGDSVYEGQTLHYIVTIKNNTGADLTNVKATVTQTNAKFYEMVTKTYDVDSLDTDKQDLTYYQEVDDKEKITTKDTLLNGEETQIEYEVIINEVEGTATTDGTISIIADNVEESKINTSYKIEQAAVKAMMISDSAEEQIYNTNNSVLEMNTKVKNLSSEDINEMIIEIPIQGDKMVSYSQETFEDMSSILEDYGFKIELLENSKNLIKYKLTGKLEPNDEIAIPTALEIGDFSNNKEVIEVYSLVTVNKKVYSSNPYKKEFKKVEGISEESLIKISQTANPADGSKIKDEQQVVYTLNIQNINSKEEANASTTVALPTCMEINKIYNVVDGQETDVTDQYIKDQEQEVVVDKDGESSIVEDDDDDIIIDSKIPVGKTIQIKVCATFYVEDLEKGVDNEKIENIFEVDDIASANRLETNKITYYASVENNSQNNNNQNNNNNNNNGDNQQNNNKDNVVSYKISGSVWKDTNRNGKQDDASSEMENVEVRAINEKGEFIINSDGNVITAKTNNEGIYEIELPKGKYMLVFIYDTGKYELTTYSNTEEGSSVVDKTISIDGNETKVAVSNLISLDSDIENINMGLVEKENFSLSLNKSISKVTVQNKEGTKVHQYDNKQFAKVEIRAKYFSGSTVLVEYKIDVTNNGDVDGYVNDVVDYIPAGYKFSTDLNNSWYTSTDKNLHNNSLANEKIKAGETKTLTLILTKTLTENDTGLIVNTAEIANSASVTGSADVNSTANNKATGEDDISSANLFVSVSTGLQTACIIGVVISIALIGLCVYMIKRGEGE